MAHIHLEDGSFPLVFAVAWWIIAICVLAICIWAVRRQGRPKGRMITIAAFCAAAAFAVFQIDIPVFGGVHLNLTPLIGILTGPAIGGLVVLIVNVLSAGIGHGGFGMIGANILVNVTEVITAYLVYRVLRKVIRSSFAGAGIATFAALFAGNIVMVAIILVSGIQGVTQSTGQILYGLALLVAINMGVAIIESVITGFMVVYLEKIRPDLLNEGTGDR
jgi:cobalt/nickel transport system permease protein